MLCGCLTVRVRAMELPVPDVPIEIYVIVNVILLNVVSMQLEVERPNILRHLDDLNPGSIVWAIMLARLLPEYA